MTSNPRLGCVGLLIVISIISFIIFFIGLSILLIPILIGSFVLYYIYIKFFKKYFYKEKVRNNEKGFTEAEYIEINKKDEKDDWFQLIKSYY